MKDYSKDPGADWPTDPNNAEENVAWIRKASSLGEEISRTQSPIEALFLCAMFARDNLFAPRHYGSRWAVETQEPVEIGGVTYQIDIAVLGPGVRVAVELDGHQFHHATKAQVERDKVRERALQSAGWQVVRFAGSEVWRNPCKCVGELVKLLEQRPARRVPTAEASAIDAAEAAGDTETVDAFLLEAKSRAMEVVRLDQIAKEIEAAIRRQDHDSVWTLRAEEATIRVRRRERRCASQ